MLPERTHYWMVDTTIMKIFSDVMNHSFEQEQLTKEFHRNPFSSDSDVSIRFQIQTVLGTHCYLLYCYGKNSPWQRNQ
jgi:hypothetical protein